MYIRNANAIIHKMSSNYINRNIEPIVLKILEQFPVLVLTGARQTGKSTLLKNLLQGSRYITLDDPHQRKIIENDPKLFINTKEETLIIDEIQYAPNLIPFIKIVVDKNRNKKGLFIITGSQNFSLMANVTESLAGRAGILQLPVFSVSESPSGKEHILKKCFETIFKGFYPDCYLENVERSFFYSSYIQTYIERDVRQIINISDLSIFHSFIILVASRLGSLFNLNEISREAGISFNSAKKWLSVLQVSGIVYLLRPYTRNIPKRVIKSPKLYFFDTGIPAYLLNYQTPEMLMTGPMSGNFAETFVISEVLKFKYNRNAPFELYFYRDSHGNEIDLILEFGNRYLLFEIKQAVTLRMEHVIAMKKVMQFFPKSKGYILGFYDTEMPVAKDIIAVNWTKIFTILEANFS